MGEQQNYYSKFGGGGGGKMGPLKYTAQYNVMIHIVNIMKCD